jgi:hypothetical protein
MGTELVQLGERYPVLRGNPAAALATIRENLGGEQLTPGDLDRVTVPAGGGLFWTVPSIDNPAGEPAKSIEGVVVFQKLTRAFWEKGIEESGGNSAPDCYSDDSILGIGSPGGDCSTCRFAAWKSDEKGRGQACKQMRALFILRPGSVLPTLVTIPPSSLGEAKKFLLRLANENLHFSSVTVKLTLLEEKNPDGIKYARVAFEVGSRLAGEDLERVQAYVNSIKPSLERVRAVEAQAA